MYSETALKKSPTTHVSFLFKETVSCGLRIWTPNSIHEGSKVEEREFFGKQFTQEWKVITDTAVAKKVTD
jgi:hypothetical protein